MMKRLSLFLVPLAFGIGLSASGQNQSAPQQQAPQTYPNTTTSSAPSMKTGRRPGGDIGSGSGDIGKGAAGGVGNAAKGAGKGAGDLVTLHPLNAAGAVGTGAAKGGKDVGVGAAKGTGKIAKGTGKIITHPF